jgi:Flp pilus assembly protein TadG
VHNIKSSKSPALRQGFLKGREAILLPFAKISNNKGQGLVEFGLMLPAILFLLIVIIEGGLLLGTYIRVLNVSRETARQIAVNRDEGVVLDKIVTHFGNAFSLNITKGDIQISYSDSQTREEATRGDTATVLVELPYNPIINLLDLVIPNTLSATSVMMIEN